MAMADDMVEVIGLKTCDACRKAVAGLKAAGGTVQLRDLRDEPPTRDEAVHWISAVGPAVLNTRSTTWRSLDAEARTADPADLIVAHPALVKRPLLRDAAGALHLGWSDATREALGLPRDLA